MVFLSVLFVLSTAPLRPTTAITTVIQPITIGVENSGPSGTGTVSGCSVTPTTIVFDGSSHNFLASPDCTLTVTVPSDGANSRYRFGSSLTFPVKTCLVGVCPNKTRIVFLELSNAYGVSALAQTTFDDNLNFKLIGTVGGVPGPVVCTIATLSTDATKSCSGWADFQDPVVYPNNPLNQKPGTRWEHSGVSFFTDSTGGNSHNIDYYKQVTKRVYLALFKPTAGGFVSPTLSYTTLGVPATFTMAIRANSLWIDYGSAWSVTNPLGGSGSSVRWAANSGTSGTATAVGLIRPVYYYQFNETFSFTVSDASTPTPPTVSFRQFGTTIFRAVPGSGFADWVNARTKVLYPKTLAGSTSTERWATSQGSLVSTLSASFDPTYYHEFMTSFSYSTSDSSHILSGIQLGYFYQFGLVPGHRILSNGSGGVLPPVAWVDAGASKVKFFTAVDVSGTERWGLQVSPDAMSVSSSGSLAESGYYHQFAFSTSYTLAGGGSPSAPSISCNSFGASASTVLSTSDASVWCDRGGTWTVSPSLLGGSTLSERWETTQVLSGTVVVSIAQTFTYFHQYFISFTFNVEGGGSPVSPGVAYFQFGHTASTAATLAGSTAWVDAGTSYLYSNPTSDSTGTERWAASSTPTGTISSSLTINPAYYHQYFETLEYTVSGTPGTPAAPIVQMTMFGSVASKAATTGASAKSWVDAGTTVTYPPTITDGTTTWTTSTTAFTASSSTTFNPVYTH